jgi:tetratricopeptide (TPR) repeat protein
VLGREFPRQLLAAVWDGPGSVPAHLAELARLDFIHELTAGGDPTYAFNHALTQEVAYESLLTAHRQGLHATAATALETAAEGRPGRGWERLAYHWTRTERPDKAVEALTRVAARAMAAYANAEAVAALREAETHAERLTVDRELVLLRLVLERSQALFLLGRVQDGLDELRQRADLVERVGDPSLTAQYHFRLASALGFLGDNALAIEHADRALAEADRVDDVGTAGRARYILSRESFWSGDPRRGVEHGRQAVVLLERAGDRWWLGMAHWARALNFVLLGQFDEALDSVTWTRTIADKLRDPRLSSQAAWTSAWIHASRGDWSTGIEAGRRALELAPDDMSRALAEGFLGVAHAEKGDAMAALPLLEQASEAFGRLRFRQLQGWFTIVQAELHAGRGDVDRATSLTAQGMDMVRGIEFAPAQLEAHAVDARLAHARGDLTGARRALGEGLALAERIGAGFIAARMHLALAELGGVAADAGALARHVADAHQGFQACGAPVWAARAAALAEAAGVMLAPVSGAPPLSEGSRPAAR